MSSREREATFSPTGEMKMPKSNPPPVFRVDRGVCVKCHARIARLSPCEHCFLAAHPKLRNEDLRLTPEQRERAERQFRVRTGMDLS
jgi:hypothetical protein